MAIFNRYKDTIDNLFNSSDAESPDQPRSIDKELCNTPKSEGSLTGLSEGIT